MAEYTKSKRFSFGWLVAGTILMFVSQFLGEMICLAVFHGFPPVGVLIGVKLFCFGATGFVMGWQSEDSTILEAGLAAMLSIVITLAQKHISFAALDGEAFVILIVVPFLAGLAGGYVGEKVQGDVIVTSDD